MKKRNVGSRPETGVYTEPDLSNVSSCRCRLRLAWFYLTCDCSRCLWGRTTTTLTDNTQQQRMTRNGHNHFCNKSENFWMARKQREREGGIVCGPELPCVAGADQTNAESNWHLILLRMNCQSYPGLSSKWELVHYGSAARYFTIYLPIGWDEESRHRLLTRCFFLYWICFRFACKETFTVLCYFRLLFHRLIPLFPARLNIDLQYVDRILRNSDTDSAQLQLLKISLVVLCQHVLCVSQAM